MSNYLKAKVTILYHHHLSMLKIKKIVKISWSLQNVIEVYSIYSVIYDTYLM